MNGINEDTMKQKSCFLDIFLRLHGHGTFVTETVAAISENKKMFLFPSEIFSLIPHQMSTHLHAQQESAC